MSITFFGLVLFLKKIMVSSYKLVYKIKFNVLYIAHCAPYDMQVFALIVYQQIPVLIQQRARLIITFLKPLLSMI